MTRRLSAFLSSHRTTGTTPPDSRNNHPRGQQQVQDAPQNASGSRKSTTKCKNGVQGRSECVRTQSDPHLNSQHASTTRMWVIPTSDFTYFRPSYHRDFGRFPLIQTPHGTSVGSSAVQPQKRPGHHMGLCLMVCLIVGRVLLRF